MPTVTTTYFNRNDVLINLQSGQGTERFLRLLESLAGLGLIVNAIEGVNRFVFAGQPSLGAGDAGYLAYVTDYSLMVRWTGAVWEFAPGSSNKFILGFVGAPQEAGWQLCDGTVTDFLTVGGATLIATPLTTPNIPAGTYLKALAAYTGAIDSAVEPGLSGSTGSTSPNTDAATDGVACDTNGDGTVANVAKFIHYHTVDPHVHDAGTLAVDSAGRPPSLGLLMYFKR